SGTRLSPPSGRVALRILRLPTPDVGTHVVDGLRRRPTELGVRLRGIGIGGRDVTRTTLDDLVRQLVTHGLLERMQELEHTGGSTRAEIPHADRLIGSCQRLQRGDVAGGE